LIKPLVRNGEPYYEVAWLGYRGQNTIEPRSTLIEDAPKIVKNFEKLHEVKFYNDGTKAFWIENP
jgi:hypothetical protein